jgi:MFS family permease
MANYFRIVRDFSPTVRFYILANAVVGFAYFGVANVIYNLFLLRMGYDLALIGRVNGVGLLNWAWMALPASLIGRRFGLRRTMMFGSSVTTTGYVLFLLIDLIPVHSRISWLYVTSSLVWLGAALVTVNGLPFLFSVTRVEARRHALAMANAAAAFMAVLGSLAAGFLPGWIATLTHSTLEQAAPYRLTFWLTPLFFLLNIYIYWRMVPAEVEEGSTETLQGAPVPIMVFLFFGGVIFLQTASEGGVRAFFNAYLDADLGVSTASIGALYGIAGLLPIFGALVMPPMVNRLGSGRALGVTAMGMAVALALIGAFPNYLAAALGFIFFNIFAALAGPIRSALSQEIVAPRWRGATSAILILGLALGWASMALLGSAIIGMVHFGGLMVLSALSGLLAAVLVLAYARLKSARSMAPASRSLEISPPMPWEGSK